MSERDARDRAASTRLAHLMAPDLLASPAGLGALLDAFARVDLRSEAEAVEVLQRVEAIKAACSALQARAAVALDEHRRQVQALNGVPTDRQGRGVAEEVALARGESPTRGAEHLSMARTLVNDMPETFAEMEKGRLPEWRATLVAREAAVLVRDDRALLDAEIATDLTGLSDRAARDRARRVVQRLDADAAAARAARAWHSRRLSVRPAGDGMAYLTAHLSTADAVRVHDSLLKEADSVVVAGESGGRQPSQVMADLLVERVTGTGTAEPRDVDLTLVMTVETLLGDDEPAWTPGGSPLPALVARGLVSDEQAANVHVRRLFVSTSGAVVAQDVRSRSFSRSARRALGIRDHLCRTSFCGAPVRDIDHATRHADGGATSLQNASGLCRRHNLVKEEPGWNHRTTASSLTVTTPTGHIYPAPPSHLVGIARSAARVPRRPAPPRGEPPDGARAGP